MKKRGIVAKLVIVLTVIGFGAWWKISRPPVYQGKSIHYWIGQAGSAHQGYSSILYSKNYFALYSIGPKAAPFLIKAAESRESAVAKWYRGIWPKIPVKMHAYVPAPSPEPDPNISLMALEVLQELIRSYDAKTFERFVPNLERLACRSPEYAVQMLAGDSLGILAAKYPVPSVVKAADAVLRTTNAAVCSSLFREYIEAWDKSGAFAFEPQVLLLNPDPGGRLFSAFLLYKYTAFTNEAMATLVEGLKVSDDLIRVRAASLLAALGESARPAVPSLIAALEVSGHESRPAILESLARLDPDRSWKPEPTVKELVLQMGDPNSAENRYEAGRRLRALGPKAIEAVPGLLARMMHDKNHACPYAEVLWAIDPSKAPEIVDAMVALLKDDAGPYRTDRFGAAIVLAKMGTAASAAMPLLKSLLEDHDTPLSQAAAYAVLKIGGSQAPEKVRALKVLTDSLQRASAHTYHRRSAARRLADIGEAGKPALPVLREVARTDGDFNVRRIASEAVENIESALKNHPGLQK